MTALPARAFSGRDKWGHVAMYAVLAGLAVLLAVGALVVDSESPFLRVLAGYTFVGAALTLGLAIADLVTRRVPAVAEGSVGGEPAVGVQAWRPEWWFANATDVGLAAAAFSLALMGVRDGEFRVPGLVVGVVGLWWAVRGLLSLTPRRNNTGLWLTRDSLVLESGEGRVTCPREAVTAVGTRGDWGVVVGMREGAVWQRPPVGWRPRDQRLGEHHAAVSLAMTANDPHDVAGWLAGELGVEAPERSTL